jgi:uncharacterized protein
MSAEVRKLLDGTHGQKAGVRTSAQVRDRLGRMLSQSAFTKNKDFALAVASGRAELPMRGDALSRSLASQPMLGSSPVSARRPAGERSSMRTRCARVQFRLAAILALALGLSVPSQAQTAADAAFDFARTLDGGGSIVSPDTYISALESDAAAGRPLALWQLGTMYENGEGVDRDPVKAFNYFSQIAIQHTDTAPRSLEADIVARSFVKLGDYYRDGVPEVGLPQDPVQYHKMLLHAATFFGDAEAQFRVGLLYQQEDGLGLSPTLSARWLKKAALKGHCMAQARLGDLLFNGMNDYPPRAGEGLMWLDLAHQTCAGTSSQGAADELLARAMSAATPEQRAAAVTMAEVGAYDDEF